DVRNGDTGRQEGLNRETERLRKGIRLHGVKHVVAVLDLGQPADRDPGSGRKLLQRQPLAPPFLVDPYAELQNRVVDRVRRVRWHRIDFFKYSSRRVIFENFADMTRIGKLLISWRQI